MANLLAGTIFMLILYFSSLFGSIFILGPALPVLWLNPSMFRSYADFALGLWLALPTVSFLSISPVLFVIVDLHSASNRLSSFLDADVICKGPVR